MKLPSSITIDGHVVRIKRAKITARFPQGYGTDGEHISRGERRTITIGTGATARGERDTVLHEALHACLDLADARRSYFTKPDEEYVIGALTPWLLTMLRDNPDLVAYLMSENLR